MERRNYILKIMYDGRNYAGWRRQGHEPDTLQQVMEETLRKMTATKVNLHAASWTDAGVHAAGQVAVMVIRQNVNKAKFIEEANNLLPADIRILDIEDAPPGFDPIGGNSGKHYRYTIWNSSTAPPDNMTCWHISEPLNVDKMNQAAKLLVGTHDFRGIKLGKDRRKNCIRTIFDCIVISKNSNIYIDINGDNFIYMMIRTITAVLVEIGAERKTTNFIKTLLSSTDNRYAPDPGPGNGLCLIEVFFDKI